MENCNLCPSNRTYNSFFSGKKGAVFLNAEVQVGRGQSRKAGILYFGGVK